MHQTEKQEKTKNPTCSIPEAQIDNFVSNLYVCCVVVKHLSQKNESMHVNFELASPQTKNRNSSQLAKTREQTQRPHSSSQHTKTKKHTDTRKEEKIRTQSQSQKQKQKSVRAQHHFKTPKHHATSPTSCVRLHAKGDGISFRHKTHTMGHPRQHTTHNTQHTGGRGRQGHRRCAHFADQHKQRVERENQERKNPTRRECHSMLPTVGTCSSGKESSAYCDTQTTETTTTTTTTHVNNTLPGTDRQEPAHTTAREVKRRQRHIPR